MCAQVYTCTRVHVRTHVWPGTHCAAAAAVLHVDVVVEVVPGALHAQEALVVGGVAVARQRVDEEVLRDVPTAGQHQHPAVHSQPPQGVVRSPLALLSVPDRER